MPAQEPATDAERRLPRPMQVAGVLVALEGLALIGLALTDVVLIVVKDPDDVTSAILGAAFAAIFGAVLIFCTRGLRAFRRAAYSPVVLMQVLAVPVGVGLVQNDRVLAAAAVLVPSIAVLLLLLLTPGGRSVLEQRD